MRFDSVIFDIDGTLWDSVDSVAKGYSFASGYLGQGHRDFSRSDIEKELGKPIREIFNDLYPEISSMSEPADADKLLGEIIRTSLDCEFRAIDEDGAILYDGVRETLMSLRNHVPLYILSNCEKGYIELFMKKSGLSDLFDGWICYADTGLDKDSNLIFLSDKYLLDSPCYVGDTEHDALMSEKVGVPFIWASYGFGTVPEELYYKRIDEFKELENIIIG